jgi:hypothetical protein
VAHPVHRNVITCGQDDVSDLDGLDLILLSEVDGIGRAKLFTGFAGTFFK